MNLLREHANVDAIGCSVSVNWDLCMKEVMFFIADNFLEELAERVAALGIVGMTATACKKVVLAERNQTVNQIVIVVQDAWVDELLLLLRQLVGEEQLEDLSINIKNLNDSVRIRDGARGEFVL